MYIGCKIKPKWSNVELELYGKCSGTEKQIWWRVSKIVITCYKELKVPQSRSPPCKKKIILFYTINGVFGWIVGRQHTISNYTKRWSHIHTHRIRWGQTSETNYSFIHGFLEYFMRWSTFCVLRQFWSFLVFAFLTQMTVFAAQATTGFWFLTRLDSWRHLFEVSTRTSSIGGSSSFSMPFPNFSWAAFLFFSRRCSEKYLPFCAHSTRMHTHTHRIVCPAFFLFRYYG